MAPLILLTVAVVSAPVRDSLAQLSCPAIVDRALRELGNNCEDMDRNSACYGYNLVTASFTEAVPEDFFTQPSDRTGIASLVTLGTSAMDEGSDVWGVALLNLQANVPNTIPGQAVRFVLVGDVEIENAVDPVDAYMPVDPVPVITDARLNIRSGPSEANNVVSVAASGEELPADALSPDGEWLRVVRRGAVGWVAREFISTEADLTALPTFDEQTRMPMQAFYLRNGIGQPSCEEAPANAIMVQGPDNITVDLSINGAEVRLSSTMLVRVLPGDEFMEITALAGEVEIDGVTVPAGFRTVVCLSPEDNRGLDGQANDRVVTCAPTEPEAVIDYSGICSLGDIPPDLLNYPVPVNCDTGIELPPPPDDDGDTFIIDCSTLRQTSPLGQAPEGFSPFYWDGVTNATGYRVTVFRQDGTVLGTFETDGATTTATVGWLEFLQNYTWEVDALLNDRVVCSTAPAAVSVVGNPLLEDPPGPPPASFNASWACNPADGNQIVVTWSDTEPNANMKVMWTDDVLGPQSDEMVMSDAMGMGVYVIDVCELPFTGGSITNTDTDEAVFFPNIDFCPGYVAGC
ncbi:MAG: SH3 domain-containing protein [Chloroflexota bacterium]